jgi:hypothetical protein
LDKIRWYICMTLLCLYDVVISGVEQGQPTTLNETFVIKNKKKRILVIYASALSIILWYDSLEAAPTC